jgi:hypothetical protein
MVSVGVTLPVGVTVRVKVLVILGEGLGVEEGCEVAPVSGIMPI